MLKNNSCVVKNTIFCKSSISNANISFDGYSILINKYVKYLKVVYDNQLSWQNHADFVPNKL